MQNWPMPTLVICPPFILSLQLNCTHYLGLRVFRESRESWTMAAFQAQNPVWGGDGRSVVEMVIVMRRMLLAAGIFIYCLFSITQQYYYWQVLPPRPLKEQWEGDFAQFCVYIQVSGSASQQCIYEKHENVPFSVNLYMRNLYIHIGSKGDVWLKTTCIRAKIYFSGHIKFWKCINSNGTVDHTTIYVCFSVCPAKTNYLMSHLQLATTIN